MEHQAVKGKSVEELRWEHLAGPSAGAVASPGGFGQQATAAGGFGAAAQPAGGGLFGGAAAQPAGGGMFGGAVAQPAGGGLFGGGAAAQPAGGMFGSPQAAVGGMFGGAAAQPAGGGLFGGAAAQPAGGGLFGGAAAQPAGGMFGGAVAQPAGGGMFGGAAAQPAGGMFGGAVAQPAGGGLFGGGAAAQPAGGMFGGAVAQPAGGGLFGSPQRAAGGGMFGGAVAQPAGGGMFGGAVAQPAGGGMFGGGGLGGAQPAGGMLGGGLQPQAGLGYPNAAAGQYSLQSGPIPPIIPQLEPIRQENKVVLPRPVYRQTPRSSTKVQPRSWTRSESSSMSRQPSMPSTPGGSTVRPAQQESCKQPLSNIVKPAPSMIRPPAPFPSSVAQEPPASPAPPQLQLAAADKEPVIQPPQLQPLSREQLSPSVDRAASSSFVIEEPRHVSPIKEDKVVESPGRHLSPREALLPPDLKVEFKHSQHGELQFLDHGELSGVVYDPRVSNGHGNIQFHGIVDISKVSIGEVVVLKYQEIEMYPKQEVPKEGDGLNIAATVQLYQMNPEYKSKKSDKMTTNPDKYRKMLQKTCQNLPGAKFVSYVEDPKHEWVWTFEMANFNRERLAH